MTLVMMFSFVYRTNWSYYPATTWYGLGFFFFGAGICFIPVALGLLCAYVLGSNLPDASPDPGSAEAKAEWYAALCGSPAANMGYDYEWSRKALNEWKAKYKAPHPPNINL